jgi:RIO kinase 1
MDEVVDFERDFRRAKQGDSLIYTTLHGIKSDLSEPRIVPDLLGQNGPDAVKVQNDIEEEGSNDSDETGGEDDDSDECDTGTDDDDDDQNDNDQNETETKEEKFKHPERQRDESPNTRRVSLRSDQTLFFCL